MLPHRTVLQYNKPSAVDVAPGADRTFPVAMPLTTQTFVGRTQELKQWSELLQGTDDEGKAVVIVGKYGMGKTWLLEQFTQTAQKYHADNCFSVRYVMGPGESPGMILRVMLDDMFQAARYAAGSLDAEGKRFEQWMHIYKKLGLFFNHTDDDFHLLELLRFDGRKNIFDQFTSRLKLLSDKMPAQGLLLLAIDPELDTLATRVELWTQVVKSLPPKIVFLFAQRYKDSLALNEEFQSQKNVHFIPSLQEHPQGLGDLHDNETEQLFNVYLPKYQDKTLDRSALLERFRQYRNHPYAVHAALHLLLSPSFTDVAQLPAEPMPSAVCPLQWKGIKEHPLCEDAVRLFKTFAVLEIPVLDEMTCWVADLPPERLTVILNDPFLGSLIRREPDGRLLYHHHLMNYVRASLYDASGELTSEAELLHQRAMTGYADLTHRSLKPDPQATVRLAEHSLAVGGPKLFAQTLCQCSDLYFALGFFQTYVALLDRALVLIPPLSPETADLQYQLGQVRQRQRDYQASVQHYKTALQTARKIASPERISVILFSLGKVSLENERLLEADMWLRDAVSYYENGTDKQGLSEVLAVAAEVQWMQGHTQEAEKLLKHALDSASRIRNYRQRARSMSAVHTAWGRMYDQLGNIDRSAKQYHKALDLTQDIYDQESEAELRRSLSSMFERVGNLKSAEEQVSRAMAIHHDLKLMERWAEDNIRLARIAEMQGKPELKELHLDRARQMYQQLGNKQKLSELGG